MALRAILAAGALALLALPASAQNAQDAERCARVAAVLDSVRVAPAHAMGDLWLDDPAP